LVMEAKGDSSTPTGASPVVIRWAIKLCASYCAYKKTLLTDTHKKCWLLRRELIELQPTAQGRKFAIANWTESQVRTYCSWSKSENHSVYEWWNYMS
jgi:hypothetical protein